MYIIHSVNKDGFYRLGVAVAAPPPPPKRYPRPGVDDGVQRIGKGAIPIAEFEEWYYGGDA